jgi:hypothetical protein
MAKVKPNGPVCASVTAAAVEAQFPDAVLLAMVSTRIRLGQRFVRPGRNVGWRYRQLVRVQIPLRQAGPAIVVQAEPFFALNSTDWGARAGFDQVRTMIGVNVPIAKSFTIESGYQLQYVRGAASDRLNHIVPITLSWRF